MSAMSCAASAKLTAACWLASRPASAPTCVQCLHCHPHLIGTGWCVIGTSWCETAPADELLSERETAVADRLAGLSECATALADHPAVFPECVTAADTDQPAGLPECETAIADQPAECLSTPALSGFHGGSGDWKRSCVPENTTSASCAPECCCVPLLVPESARSVDCIRWYVT